MKKIVKWLLLITVIAGAAWLAHAFWRCHAMGRAYASIARGDTEGQILQRFGQPYQITGPPRNIAWDSEDSIRTNSGECVREFWYAPPLDFVGESWVIGFDTHSNAISKYHYLSP